MKKTLLFAAFIFLSSLNSFSQNGIIGEGFTPGWGVGDIQSFSGSAGTSKIITRQSSMTGDRYFRLVKNVGGDFNQFGPFSCTDVNRTSDNGVQYDNMPICNSSGAFYITVDNTSHNYVFKTPSEGADDFVYFRIDGAVGSISTVSQSPTSVPENVSVGITASAGSSLPTGQAVFLRYTTDNFVSSTVVKMTGSFGLFYNASIPGFVEGTEVIYYVFTSGDIASISPANADWFTINLNNGGSNYSYIVGAALPAELSIFTAKKKGNYVELNWTTSQEMNNDYFEVERRNEEKNEWQKVGRITGNGTSNQKNDYQFLDKEAISGLNYYRLLQVDLDGESKYSETISVIFEKELDLQFFPNPTKDIITISLNEDFGEGELHLIDLNGKLLRKNILLKSELNSKLDLAEFPKGVYFLRIVGKSGSEIFTEKIIKK